MARKVGNSKLDTRSARLRLAPRREPYWSKLQRGLALGYRRTDGPNGSWIARHYDPAQASNKQYRALGTADDRSDADGAGVLTFDQAQAMAREWLAGLKRPAPSDESMTVEDACTKYLSYIKAEKRSYRNDSCKIRLHIVPVLGTRPVAALTVDELEAWKRGLVRLRPDAQDPREAERKSKDTANRTLTVLKAALSRACPKLRPAPWQEVRKFKDEKGRLVGRAREVVLDAEQVGRFIDAATEQSPAFGRLVTASFLVGWRAPGEVEHVRVRDFDPNKRTLRLRYSKTGERRVKLTGETAGFFSTIAQCRNPDDLLMVRDDGTPWTRDSHNKLLRRTVRLAKLPKGTCLYTCRHTHATECIRAGMNLITLAENLGTSVKMLEDHYVKLSDDATSEIVEAHGFKVGLRPVKVAA
jgi:integrase